jgi:hypothetical protein
MSTLFLSHDELTELTGFKQTKGHVRWLERHGWRFALTRSEQPRVARDYFLHRMGMTPSRSGYTGQDHAALSVVEPDFGALDRL